MGDANKKQSDKKKQKLKVLGGAVGLFSMTAILWQLTVAFGRANIFGFGGGPSVIPLIQQEVVDNYKWLTTEEFTDALAFGNALPGPIATKMAAYVGYKMAGLAGSVTALLGTIVPSAAAMLALAGVYFKYKDAPQIVGILKGVRPVVVILLVQTAWEMGSKSFPNISTWVIALIALIAVFALRVHPIILILASMTYGFFFLSKQ